MSFRSLAILALMLCFLAAPAFAQNEKASVLASATYKTLARQAISQRPRNFDFTTFRSYYPLTEMYDPIGEITRSKLVALAFAARHDPDKTKRESAIADYADLLAAHLANVDVLLQARALSEEDRAFGDPEFFDWMISGLITDVRNSGDGQSLAGAYDIMTLGEESLLMASLGRKVLKSESQQEADSYYTMNQVDDPKGYGTYWIFLDTTVPLDFLQRQKRQAGTRVLVPKQ